MELRFFLVYAALFAPYSVLTPYLQQLLHLCGFRYDQIGLIQGVVELMAVLAPPVWGMLSDKCRRPRFVLVLTVLLSIPAIHLFHAGMGTWAAIGAAFLFGLFNKPSISLTDGLTFGYFKRSGCDYGHVRIGGTIGYVICVFLWERLFKISRDTTGHLILLLMTGALIYQALSVLAIPRMDYERTNPSGEERKGEGIERMPWHLFLNSTFIGVVITAFMARFAMMSYYGFFSRYLNDVYGYENVGYIWLIGSAAEFPVIFWSNWIIAKIGVKKLFLLAHAGTFLRLIGFAFELGIVPSSLMQLFHALTFGAYHCSTVTYVSRAFPAKYQGTAQTVYAALTIGLGGLLGNTVGGIVLRHYGYTAMYTSFSVIAVFAFVISLFIDMDMMKAQHN